MKRVPKKDKAKKKEPPTPEENAALRKKNVRLAHRRKRNIGRS